MDKPRRIQLKRTKGWRMPENTVKVDRSTKWGNPFRVRNPYNVSDWGEDDTETREEAVCRFGDMMADDALRRDYCFPAVEPLRGKNLACWCPLDQPCHADVLLELANADTPHTGDSE